MIIINTKRLCSYSSLPSVSPQEPGGISGNYENGASRFPPQVGPPLRCGAGRVRCTPSGTLPSRGSDGRTCVSRATSVSGSQLLESSKPAPETTFGSNAARLLSIGTALELLVCSLGGHAAGAGTGLEILVATTEGIVKRTHANGATYFYNSSQPRCSSKSST